MSDDFEWDITEDEDEASSAAGPVERQPAASTPPPPPDRRGPSTPLWLGLILGVAAAAALGVWLSSRDLQHGQLRQTVEAMANDERGPAPLSYSLTDISSRTIRDLRDEGAGRIAATLVFTATDVDGTVLTFKLDRAYSAEGTLLRRIDAELDTQTTILAPAGLPHVELVVGSADRDFVEREVAEYLNDVAKRACELWVCPPDASARLSFTGFDTGVTAETTLPIAGSWQLAVSERVREIGGVRVAPPHIAGIPADGETLDAYRRALALQMLPVLAELVVLPDGRVAIGRVNGLLDALVARTAVHLGIEPVSVLSAHPLPDDDGLLNALTQRRAVSAERAFLRLNAVLGPEPQEVERLTWRRLETADQTDVTGALLYALAEAERDPVEAFALMFGTGPAQTALGLLRESDWIARAECLDRVIQFDRSGARAFAWDPDTVRPVLNLYNPSPDGRWQPLVLADVPILLDQTTGALTWLPTAGGAIAFNHSMDWQSENDLGLASFGQEAQGVYTVGIHIEAGEAGEAQLTVGPYEMPGMQFPDAHSSTHLEWTLSDYSNDSFNRTRLVRSNGTLAVDFGLATRPVANPATGEYAVLDLSEDDEHGLEYRVRVFANAEDTDGRVVWESSSKALYAEPQPHAGAIAWIPRTHQIALVIQTVESLRDMFVEAGLWIIDPDTAHSDRLWWQPVTGIRAQSWALSNDQAALALSNWDSGSSAVAVQIVSIDTGETIRTFSLYDGQHAWARTGQGFALIDAEGVQLFAAPDQPAPIQSAVGSGCRSVLWGPIPIGASDTSSSIGRWIP